MNSVIHKENSLAIIHDAGQLSTPVAQYFSAEYWRSVNALRGSAPGRGNAWFVDAPFGQMVLRRYLRGGWAARMSREHYLYTGAERSRPIKEFRVLVALQQAGLSVPIPVGALCEYHGLLSTGALLTHQIPHTHALADILQELDIGRWRSIGQCIGDFHAAGLWHADLNARNILLDLNGRVFLVDFDRARFTPGHAVNGNNNLQRLHRSLRKYWRNTDQNNLEAAWGSLMDAYCA